MCFNDTLTAENITPGPLYGTGMPVQGTIEMEGALDAPFALGGHCMHFTQMVLAMMPPSYIYLCCFCGGEQAVQVEWRPARAAAHGQFVPTMPTPVSLPPVRVVRERLYEFCPRRP